MTTYTKMPLKQARNIEIGAWTMISIRGRGGGRIKQTLAEELIL
jgi:hypothetical protein